MGKPAEIQLNHPSNEARLKILYEDRSVLAVDKPAGWMLVPFNWQKTNWNLQAAINSSIAAGDFWARSRNLKYLRHIHRLDAETSGILLFAKSPGALMSFGRLFESRQIRKIYLAVIAGGPKTSVWACRLKLAPDPEEIGKMRIDPAKGKIAETHFRILQRTTQTCLVEARPITGRTHQIRLHLAASATPVLGDRLYGSQDERAADSPAAQTGKNSAPSLALRAIQIDYRDPFQRRFVQIKADASAFLAQYGFGKV